MTILLTSHLGTVVAGVSNKHQRRVLQDDPDTPVTDDDEPPITDGNPDEVTPVEEGAEGDCDEELDGVNCELSEEDATLYESFASLSGRELEAAFLRAALPLLGIARLRATYAAARNCYISSVNIYCTLVSLADQSYGAGAATRRDERGGCCGH